MKSKAVLISIKPRYVSLISDGSKKYELRRKCPNVKEGDLVFVYESSPTMCLVGAFLVGRVIQKSPIALWRNVGNVSGVSRKEFLEYFSGCEFASAIEISEYWELDNRISLNKLREVSNIEPPQSYRYLCEEKTGNILAQSSI
ncbi:MAG: ASCH domain-containing protein [Pseudomonadota bacterium]|nr:ASCH domain-containing protein [Pseudomonadota bacterium]